MKYALWMLTISAAVIGCQKKPVDPMAAPADPSVMDSGGYRPAPQPVSPDPVAPMPSPASAPPSAPAGGSYTIQKGDTFISIARAKYNDPAAFKRIAAANPGVDPSKLKVGQVINLP